MFITTGKNSEQLSNLKHS